MFAALVQAKRADLSMNYGSCMLNTLHTVILCCVGARVVMWGCVHKPKQDRNMIWKQEREAGAGVARHDGGWEGWEGSEDM